MSRRHQPSPPIQQKEIPKGKSAAMAPRSTPPRARGKADKEG
jgi:hypothetical protein